MTPSEAIALPLPRQVGSIAIEETLWMRRSVRDFVAAPMSLEDLAQLLWAAQGVTGDEGRRTAPSAGGLYPLELQVIAGDVETLPAGLYRYRPDRHTLECVRAGDFRSQLADLAQQQEWLKDAAAILAFAAVESRTSHKYGARSARFIALEIGHAAQNVLLQAVTLGFAGTPVGAFDDDRAAQLMGVPPEERILYFVPIGKAG